ncbi:hypothetical protein ACFPAF_16450 [Hymenobacter endophyticus]|uniref:Secreted protein n=1 Tax=Hymenobacter endophyticus TaxID=3076335 RepID=A0ABU3TKU7_9BACT|nr:hypothetical protein [Hymenobacter endophyticus]MDU0371994.1 hypothetical protein [Hymenobacter endophyticus]
MQGKFQRLLKTVRQKGKKVAVVGALATGVMLAAAPANKAEAKLFGSGMHCDANGGGTWSYWVFGIRLGTGTTIPNSAFCD